ncbi:MAG: phage tail tape measure protein, partial [Proteobacteria bacterium]|nr:phage tail tape measure protein [Pseudomonadota bacterium]
MTSARSFKWVFVVDGDASKGVQALKQTKTEADKLTRAQKKSRTEAKKLTAQNKRLRTGYNRLNKRLDQTRTLMNGVAIATVAMITGKVIQDAAAFEKGLVGIGKTTGLLGKELLKVGVGIDAISIKTGIASKELLEIGVIAGQMNVRGVQNLLGFTEAVAKMTRTTTLGAEEAALALARILNLTSEGPEMVGQLASIVTALGNETAASEANILTLTTQLAQSTKIFKLSSAELAAYGATLAGLGARAEGASSAIGRSLRIMVGASGDELKALNKLVGATGDQFVEAIEKDAVSALNLFLREIGKIDSAKEQIQVLEDIGLKGERILRVLPVLAAEYDKLQASQKTANKELKAVEEGLESALDEEFGRTLETFTGQWDRFASSVTLGSKALGDDMLPALTGVFKTIADATEDGTIAKLYGGFVKQSSRMLEPVFALIENLSMVAGGVKKLIREVHGIPQPVATAGRVLSTTAKAVDQTTDSADELAKSLRTVKEEFGDLPPEMVAFIDSLDQSAMGFIDWAEVADEAADTLENFVEELDATLDRLNPINALMKKYRSEVDLLDKGLAAGIITQEQFDNALVKLG